MNPKPYVYFFRLENGWTKIGVTRDPDGRVRGLLSLFPVPAKEAFVVKVPHFVRALAFERNCHEIFAGKKLNGEWFDLSEIDMAPFRNRKITILRRVHRIEPVPFILSSSIGPRLRWVRIIFGWSLCDLSRYMKKFGFGVISDTTLGKVEKGMPCHTSTTACLKRFLDRMEPRARKKQRN